MLTIRFKKLDPRATAPKFAHGPHEDAAADLFALDEVILQPNVPALVRTGIALEIPSGYVGRILERSGMALKHGIRVGGGVIDPAYRGDVGVVLIWGGNTPNIYQRPEEYDPEIPNGGTTYNGYTFRFGVYPPNDDGSVLASPAPLYSERQHLRLIQMASYVGFKAEYYPRYRVEPGQRIAQLCIQRYEPVEYEEAADELMDTVRAAGGFGSSGK
jgi:dUTP pyrophosphatase